LHRMSQRDRCPDGQRAVLRMLRRFYLFRSISPAPSNPGCPRRQVCQPRPHVLRPLPRRTRRQQRRPVLCVPSSNFLAGLALRGVRARQVQQQVGADAVPAVSARPRAGRCSRYAMVRTDAVRCLLIACLNSNMMTVLQRSVRGWIVHGRRGRQDVHPVRCHLLQSAPQRDHLVCDPDHVNLLGPGHGPDFRLI
jgi:hypothetical protein